MDTKICPKCGATWIGGQHYWSGTQKEGDPHDLAGLVCNRFGDNTWEKRLNDLTNDHPIDDK
jgi:putative alpha-1,2-mannosidase